MMNYGMGDALMGGSQRDGAPQGLGGQMQPNVPQQMMAQKKRNPLETLLSSGILGLLPALLGGGGLPGALNKGGAPSPLGMGLMGQLGGLLGK